MKTLYIMTRPVLMFNFKQAEVTDNMYSSSHDSVCSSDISEQENDEIEGYTFESEYTKRNWRIYVLEAAFVQFRGYKKKFMLIKSPTNRFVCIFLIGFFI